MLTKQYANAFGQSEGFTVVALAPGWVQTDLGGKNAPLTPEESVSAVLKTISELTPSKTGSFIDRFGEPLPY
ncbi:hypothetical protein V1514DRAFT_86216 [Lipomyces japonicus]|uniref:uncharacterized protein n=1 Tax=Lipomyces japonicus TaxID=56871 RepID=UPI0034CEC5F8